MTPTVCAVPRDSKQGTKSAVTNKGEWWRRKLCHLGPKHFTARDINTSTPQMALWLKNLPAT